MNGIGKPERVTQNRALKQAMMQELLAGKTCIVSPGVPHA